MILVFNSYKTTQPNGNNMLEKILKRESALKTNKTTKTKRQLITNELINP